MKFLALLLLLAAPAAAQRLPGLQDPGGGPQPSRHLAGYLNGGLGWNMPAGGHWGDRDAGFSSSPMFTLSASKSVDPLLSYGGEVSYSGGYASRGMDGLGLRLVSLTPFIRVSVPEGRKVYYGIMGAGVYQWSQPAFSSGGTRYASDAGSSAGLNLGGGISAPFLGALAGLELRWHHILNLSGANFDLGAADSVNLSVSVTCGVWRAKKRDSTVPAATPLTSQ